MSARATAIRVVTEESQALATLAAALDGPLGGALEEAQALILAATGRVIVSGMGKSGHVARKIAATLASTGTPAHFVHPAEASHGDMGQMLRGDVVLVLSYSGETSELAHLVAYTRRFGIPLVAMAAHPDSTLMRAADIGLILPVVAEACGIGVVPTTSTAMMLALGDALAIALMTARAFTPAAFRDFHPGGRLGVRLTPVRDLMHGAEALPLVGGDAPMSEALLVISRQGFGVAGVVDASSDLVGIITDGDLRRHMAGLLDRTAAEVMTPRPRTIAPGALAEEAVRIMNEARITCLFVAEPEAPARALGLLHIHDCLRAGLG